MKKKIILPFLLVVLLLMPFASASIFDWINNLITGRATEETAPISIINEQVKCIFLNSNTEQKCYTSDGKFSCVGVGNCVVDVSGETGAKLEWKSSCSGYPAYTTIDATNENAEFKCEIPATPICGNGACESGETCSSCPADCGQCTTQEVKEQVKCIFLNSNSEQKCYTSDGKFACSGIGSCAIGVSGQQGQQLLWKNSCGSEAYTKIDGIDDSMEFNCEPRAIPAPTSTETVTVPAGEVYEEVTCDFANSNTIQQCYSEDKKFSCSGKDRCLAKIYGKKGERIIFKGTCKEGYSEILIDGVYGNVWFNCEQAQTQTPAITPVPTTTQIPAETQIKEAPIENMKEHIRCVFKNSNAQQECHSGDSKYSCSGIGNCIVYIYGQKGAQVTWGSSCGGYDYTSLDGIGEDAEFDCGPGSASTSTRDKVKLHYFYWEKDCSSCESEKSFLEKLKLKYSQVEYDAYSIDDRTKTSTYSYFVVSNLKQGMPTIFLDNKIWIGYNDNIATEIESKVSACLEKGCSLTPAIPAAALTPATQTSIPSMPVQEALTYKVKLYFFWKKDCEDCMRGMEFAKLLLQKYQPLLRIQLIDISTPDAMNYFSNVLKSVGAKTSEVPTTIVDDKIWVGYNDGIAREIEKKVIECVEKDCRRGVQPAVPTQTMPTSNMAKEQVECIFWNSDVLQNPHTARPEEGYGNAFGCKWTGEVVEKEFDGKKQRYANCIAEVSGEKGTQLIWKSSCGGYAYTSIDGNNEAAEFKCIPSSEVKKEQISGKGFKRAYWQCYDGAEQKAGVSESVSCKSSEVWQKEAEEFCRGHCYADGSKCGVNSFSVMDECYIEAREEGVIFAVPEKPRGGKKFAMPPDSKTGDIMAVYFYSDACRHCSGMNEEVDKVSKQLNIYIKRIDIINNPELVESYGIKGVPAFLVLRYESDGIKEFLRYGRADSTAIINWINKPATPATETAEKPAEIDKVKEEISVICKDSCPLDGKCYPFGYRKTGKYCSDEGAFKEQLEADAVCDNNFECSTNVCVDGKCVSSGLINKVMNWFKKLFFLRGGEEAKEEIAEIVDCGASTECLENAFKKCKPAKMSQSQGPISEMAVVGLEGKKCVLKMTGSAEMTGGAESMTCKFENYALGMKDMEAGSLEQYCTGKLTYWLTAAPKMIRAGEAPASAPEAKPSTEMQPQQTKQENIQEPVTEEAISREVKVPAQTEALNAISACEKIFFRETNLKYKCTAMVKKDASDCEMLDESSAPYCYADVALVTGNSAICGKIKDSDHKEACEALVEKAPAKCSKWIYADYCYRDVAALIGDTSICDYIKYEGGKIECKAVILRDASLCENSDNQDCYQKIALITGDEKACDDLKKREVVEEGSRRVIYNLDNEVSRCIEMAKKEMTGCSTTVSNSGIDCDLIPAMAKNPSLCENLETSYPGDVTNKGRCYFYSAMMMEDLLPPQLIVLRN